MIGIYKITTPTGRIYIGQSVNIKKRWNDHKWPLRKGISSIARSIQKYGYLNHSFELIHELPSDVDNKILAVYESLYMDLYRTAGFSLLNIADAKGSNFGYKPSEETLRNHSEKLKGRPSHRKGTTHTDEAKAKIKAKRALQTNVKGRPIGNVAWNKGKTGLQIGWNKGISPSAEVRAKISSTLMGSKLSPETIAKRTASVMARTERKRQWSDEARKRQSERYKGIKRADYIKKSAE